MHACMHVLMCALNSFYNVKIERLGHFFVFVSDLAEGPPLVPA